MQLVLVGSNFLSANGRILVTFDGVAAPTRCPSPERCLATVPPAREGARLAQVVVHTESGASNALAFHYR